jgi:hypothetical protein
VLLYQSTKNIKIWHLGDWEEIMWRQLDLLISRETQENEREFYGLLGLVAVRFARMEFQLITLLGALINPGEACLTDSLTEGFNISKSIDIIKKISYIRGELDDELNAIVKTADRIRKDRNDYIHGIWEIKLDSSNNVIAKCNQRPKRKYKKNKTLSGTEYTYTRTIRSTTVTLDDLVQTAKELEDITKEIEEILQRIEDDPDIFS